VRDWVHPFVHGLSNYVVDALSDAISLLDDQGCEGLRSFPPLRPGDAIAYYRAMSASFGDGSMAFTPMAL
jgi:hypothetical protein